MLKNGGYIIFSVPYNETGTHIEHFPELYNYKIVKENKEYVLYNSTINNVNERFTNLCFHGGPGNVLEMRMFSKDSIISFLKTSGFIDITFHKIDQDMNKYGIFWGIDNNINNSLIITAMKPLG